MQVRHEDGSYGKIAALNQKELENWVKEPNVKHVEVFEGTPEEIERRQKLQQKFSVKKRFQKAPKNNKR